MNGSPNDCLESQGDDVQRQFIMPQRRTKKYPKLEPIKCEIDVSLEELLQGHIKEVPIERIVKFIDKEITVIKDFTVKIDIGVEAGTLVTFPQEGNNTLSDILPGDVIFIINDKPHRFFKRINQCDIEYTAQVIHPIDGKSIDIKIPTLELNKEFEIISYKPNEIYEGSEKRILGGGLPKIDDNTQRGDLVIRVKLVEVIESVEVEKNDQDSGIRIFNPMKDTKIEQKQNPIDKEDVPVVNKHKLWLSLNEVFSGCTKTKTIPIIKINKVDGEITENKEFTIEIRPGVQTGKEITFAQQGDEQSDGSFADVVFVVHDIYNVTFQRDGPNIKYIAKISHNLMKSNEIILIPTLEGENLELKLDDKIEQSSQKTFYRNGLPYSSDPKMLGNLFVRFEIVSDQLAKQNAILVKKQETRNEVTGKPENSIDEKDENLLAKNAKQDQSNELNFELELTLREIYTGCVKSEKIPRNLIYEKNETGEITTNITIEPGSFGGTKIYWPQKENQDLFDEISKRIVFTVVEKDETFTRLGNNVVLTAEVTTYDLFHKRKINIPTLDNDFEKLSLSDEITNAITIKIPNRGFPYYNGENKIGDLLVKFNITNSPIDPPVKHTLSVTLEEIMVGKLQNIKLTKWLLSKNGKQHEVEKVFEVWVPPGTESGKQIVYKQESDQNLGSIPADIVFIIDVKEHAIFSRNCADIVYIAKVTQVQLSRGEKLEIPILESKSKTLSLTLEKSFNQNTVKRYENYGLPNPNNQNNRGDMIVRFEIIKEIKDPIIESDIHLTLENILHGFIKQVIITREKFENGQIITEDKDVDIDVKPGTVAGTRYPFKNLGDEKPGIIPSDIVFIARDKKHVNFQRSGCDIKNFQLITQHEAQKSVRIEIPTLEEDIYLFHDIKKIHPQVYKGFVKKFSDYGLPKFNNTSKRGDLLVYYEIVSNEKKVKNLKINVEISLEEILTGINKKVEFATNSIGLSGETIIENKVVSLDIKPGLELPDRFVAPRRGNKKPFYAPGDALFFCNEKRHPHFTRDGAHLIYTAKITSKQAKLHRLNIPTLDNGFHPIEIENINKNSKIYILNMGLPFYYYQKNRGNIVVHFEIIDDVYSDTENQILERNTPNVQASPIEFNFLVPLENILKGSIEYVKVPTTKFDGEEIPTNVSKTLSIIIRPGEITGKKFLFAKEGNQHPGKTPSDIVCILQDLPHEKFKRNGQNIEHVLKIQSRKKILNTNVEIPTLENDVLSVAVNEENIDNIVIPGFGLPHPDEPTSRGELFVRFVEDNFEPSDPPQEKLLNLTLHEICNGCEKIFNIDVNQKDSNENSEQQVKTVHVKIEPGAETGKRIYFEYKNDEYHQNDRRGDVVFIVHDEYHVVFKRCGVDLVYTHFVTTSQIREAKNCLIINVPTLENDEVELKITENIREDIAYPVENRGLPYPNNPKLRGKILVLLKIIKTKNLTTWV